MWVDVGDGTKIKCTYRLKTAYHLSKLICVAYQLTCDLGLPDGVSHAPQSRKDKENYQLVRIWLPVEEANDTGDVGHSS